LGTTHTLSISPSSNRLVSTTGPAPAKSNTYDNAGNLLSDGTIQYGYSPRGRLIKVTNGATVVQSRYNALGQRVEKSNGDVFMYDEDGHLIGEYSKSTGRMQREIVYLGDEPVALLTQTVTGTAPSQVVTPNVFYIFSDHLGTPRMITQATDNAIRWRWDEGDPFGLQPPNENPSGPGALTFNLRMPGQYYDRESNLFYNYYRDYDPQLGRYVQSDPIGLDGGIDTYGYVEGNPLSKVDPTGEIAFVPILIGIGAGMALDYGLSEWKKANCGCAKSSGTPGGQMGNATVGAADGFFGAHDSKPRAGVDGGGPAGKKTSIYSLHNHLAARNGAYSIRTRNFFTSIARKVPYAGAAFVAYEIYDTFKCD
jgi:RHS repeat-associated protein